MSELRWVARRIALLLTVGACLAAPNLTRAATEQGPSSEAGGSTAPQSLQLSQVALSGTVSYSDGEPVPAGAPVRVWDVKEVRFVQQSETGEGGAYRLPALAPGSYQAVFADRLRVPVVVSEAEGEEPAVFNVVIPRGTAAFARMPIEQKAVILSVMTEKWAGGDLSEQTAEADDDDEDQILVGLLPAIIGIGAGSCCAKVCITQDWCGLDDDDDDRGRRLPVSP